MGLDDSFAFYAAYHADDTNKAIHVVFVPTILWSALLWLTQYDAEHLLPGAVTDALPAAIPGNAALLLAAIYVVGYLCMAPQGLVGVVLVSALLYSANAAALYLGATTLWKVAIMAHVIGWAIQFYGHDVYEGRQPALFSSLFQSLFMAPLFVSMEVVMHFGGFSDFHKRVTPLINRKMRDIRQAEKKAAGTAE